MPKLADEGRYVASESIIYRVLRAAGQMRHRERSSLLAHARPRELRATRPNQVWTWDITYLLSMTKGVYFHRVRCAAASATLRFDHWPRSGSSG